MVSLPAFGQSVKVGEQVTLTTLQGKKISGKVSSFDKSKVFILNESGGASIAFTNLAALDQLKFGYDSSAIQKQKEAAAKKKLEDEEKVKSVYKSAEANFKANKLEKATENLNQILNDFPQSKQAGTVIAVKNILSEKDKKKSAGFTIDEATRFKDTMNSYEVIKKNYGTVPKEKREALDNIFGRGLFTQEITIETTLLALKNLEDSRQKALNGR